MFTGLVEGLGRVVRITPKGSGVEIAVDVSSISDTPQTGASIAIDGACQTVTRVEGSIAFFDSVKETVSRTTLGFKKPNSIVNLESALKAGEPLDGHIVQGHVDCVGTYISSEELSSNRVMKFSMPSSISSLVAKKGSIAINGISLTVVEAGADYFTVSVIPETLKRTTLNKLKSGDKVNLEADVLARYIARQLQFPPKDTGLTFEKLREKGF